MKVNGGEIYEEGNIKGEEWTEVSMKGKKKYKTKGEKKSESEKRDNGKWTGSKGQVIQR